MGTAIYYHQWMVAPATLALWLMGRGIKILPHLKRHPEDLSLVPVFVAINFLTAVIKLFAIVTLRDQKWIREHQGVEGISQGVLSELLQN
jgi:hypothetical protein